MFLDIFLHLTSTKINGLVSDLKAVYQFYPKKPYK